MSDRHFYAGQQGRIEYLEWRVVEGQKFAGDLVLEFLIPGQGWLAAKMEFGALMADFFYENEDARYPPSKGFDGGKRYTMFLGRAIRQGWKAAALQLAAERPKKDAA